MQEHRSSHWRCAVQIREAWQIFGITFQGSDLGFQILPEPETRKRQWLIARLSRELGCGDFVKIEIMRDSKYLLPDNHIKATEILAKEGFVVMPQMYPDLNVARDLCNAGAASSRR